LVSRSTVVMISSSSMLVYCLSAVGSIYKSVRVPHHRTSAPPRH
jgi:hypothetical protein